MSEQPPPPTVRQTLRHPIHSLATTFPERRIGRTAQRLEQNLEQRRARWEQFREDYADGGGIKEGVKQAFNWGILAGVVGGMGGGIVGGILDGLLYSLDNSGGKGSQPQFDTNISADNVLENIYTLIPLVLATISALALGGYAFYKGLMSPAYEGRRMREYHWEDYH